MVQAPEQNPQYVRTHNAIVRAFIQLLKHMSFEQMTVQDILNETPVTRATFYRHFKDKYEIAEYLFQTYINSEKALIETLKRKKKDAYADLFRAALDQKRDEVEALLKIHTDRVDLRAYLETRYEEAYIADAKGEYVRVEAKIYAAAMTAFHLSFLQFPQLSFPINVMDMVMTPVFLRTIELDKDAEAKAFIREKCRKRPYTPKKT